MQAEGTFETMLGYLDETIELYQRLLDLSKRKERCLVSTELTALEELVSEEQQLIASATQVEARRMRLQQELAVRLGCPGDQLTITRLLDAADAPAGERLLAAQNRLTGVLRELAEQNDLNASLIEQSLAYTDFLLRALQGPKGQTYDTKGQMGVGTGQTSRVFDRKV